MPVDQLLQDEVPRGMSIEGRQRQHLLERRQVAVQVADDHHVLGGLERDRPPDRPGRRPEQLGGLADGGQDFLGSGIGSCSSGGLRHGIEDSTSPHQVRFSRASTAHGRRHQFASDARSPSARRASRASP